MHRHPSYWDKPGEFDPFGARPSILKSAKRPQYVFFPFAAGCAAIGLPFAFRRRSRSSRRWRSHSLRPRPQIRPRPRRRGSSKSTGWRRRGCPKNAAAMARDPRPAPAWCFAKRCPAGLRRGSDRRPERGGACAARPRSCFTATLAIADVRAFVSDATHTGTLAGTVEISLLAGSDLPVALYFSGCSRGRATRR